MSDNIPRANDETLSELALRLLSIPGEDHPQLLVGQLPPALPFELPLPEGSRVLGALMRSPEDIDIVADSNLAPDDILNFYKEQLQSAGWKLLEPIIHSHRGGFVHTVMQRMGPQLTFCRGARGPALTVNAYEGQGTLTDLRLSVNMDTEHSPCEQQARMQRHPREMQNLIPALMPPRESQQQPHGGGGGGDSWHSTATLNSDRDAVTISSHYAEQLSKAGWTRDDEGHDQRVAWHSWTFEDEEHEKWRGLFLMLKTPAAEGRYFLFVRIERAGGGQNSWSSFGYSPMRRL